MPRTNAERAEKAYRAVLNYEADSSTEECISDLLGDLRHLCDESGYDFAERDGVGYRNYTGELADDGVTSASERHTAEAPNDLGEALLCRTMGSNLHMNRGEMLALLGHMQEPDGGAVIRRRLEVLLGEKTLGQVDDEAEQERQRRRVEPLTEGAYRVLCGLVQPSDVIDPFDVTGPDAAWEQLRRIFPAADASTIDTEESR